MTDDDPYRDGSERFDPPPDPDDPEWDEWADDVLADVEYDAELGKAMARDALRLAAGEFDAAAFHDHYHEAVVDEFGVDERPTAPSEPGPTSGSDSAGHSIEIPDPDDAVDRRAVLKAGGAAAVGLGLASAATGAAGAGDDGVDDADGTQLGMTIDLERCIACLLCVEACKEENDTDRGAHWMHVFRYTEDESDEMDGSLPRPCQHCTRPSCTYVCPTQARFKRGKDGLVLVDHDVCIGCKYCSIACPYGVNFLGTDEPTDKSPGFGHSRTDDEGRAVAGSPPEGVMGKCTFCVHRQDSEGLAGTTACEQACPVDAISFGDVNDPESDPRRHLDEKRDSSTFSLLEGLGNEPNVTYIGDEPSSSAEPTDGPFTYEDLGMVTLADDGGES